MGLRWWGGCSLLLHDINDITLVISLLLHNGYYQVVLVCVWLSLWTVYKNVGCFSCILNNFIIRICYRFFFSTPSILYSLCWTEWGRINVILLLIMKNCVIMSHLPTFPPWQIWLQICPVWYISLATTSRKSKGKYMYYL